MPSLPANPSDPRAPVRHLGRAKIVPSSGGLLLPYQVKWVADASPLKIAEKSRQIGWALALALHAAKEANAPQFWAQVI